MLGCSGDSHNLQLFSKCEGSRHIPEWTAVRATTWRATELNLWGCLMQLWFTLFSIHYDTMDYQLRFKLCNICVCHQLQTGQKLNILLVKKHMAHTSDTGVGGFKQTWSENLLPEDDSHNTERWQSDNEGERQLLFLHRCDACEHQWPARQDIHKGTIVVQLEGNQKLPKWTYGPFSRRESMSNIINLTTTTFS